MKRHELTDGQWALISEFFPPRPPEPGGQWGDDRATPNGTLRRLNTGAARRDLAERFGPWQAVRGRFSPPRRSGLLDRSVGRRRRLDGAGLIDPGLFCAGGTNARAARAAGGAAEEEAPAR